MTITVALAALLSIIMLAFKESILQIFHPGDLLDSLSYNYPLMLVFMILSFINSTMTGALIALA